MNKEPKRSYHFQAGGKPFISTGWRAQPNIHGYLPNIHGYFLQTFLPQKMQKKMQIYIHKEISNMNQTESTITESKESHIHVFLK
jgi:hypothetical protein